MTYKGLIPEILKGLAIYFIALALFLLYIGALLGKFAF